MAAIKGIHRVKPAPIKARVQPPPIKARVKPARIKATTLRAPVAKTTRTFTYPLSKSGTIGSTPADHARRPLHNWESDRAVDILTRKGTPVIAVANGVIGKQFGPLNSKSPLLQGLRLHLVTKGDEFYYAHLSRFKPGIGPGSVVKKGDVLGYTGVANGVAHLHFGVKNADPMRVLRNAQLKPPNPRKPAAGVR